jgi:toluene monooxygenase system protein B
MARLPLTTSFEGDFILKLVVVDEDDTMDRIAAETASHTAGRTAPARTGAVLRVRRQDAASPFPRDATARAAKLVPMECVEVYYEARRGG